MKNCTPVSIRGSAQIPIEIDVEFPSRVGIDRLLNVFAASRMLQEPRPVIAIDSGTATTVDLMTTDRVFRGGSILPGLRLSAHAMHDYTARLPLLNVDEELATLPEVPGRNTEAAMRAGLFIGQLGAVKELTARLTVAAFTTFRESVSPQLFVTGGGGRHLVEHLPNAIFVDSLALHGLAMLSACSKSDASGSG
jgi:type III pantothenate kinase